LKIQLKINYGGFTMKKIAFMFVLFFIFTFAVVACAEDSVIYARETGTVSSYGIGPGPTNNFITIDRRSIQSIENMADYLPMIKKCFDEKCVAEMVYSIRAEHIRFIGPGPAKNRIESFTILKR
jgi:hypothetical protein